MTKHITLFLLFLGATCCAQQAHSGIVLTKNGQEPIEFVSVFNSNDNTMTNADGRFKFTSKLDSVFFYSPGYEKLATTFSALKDTIYLQKNIFELDEVVVTNQKSLLQEVFNSIDTNYSSQPYREKFMLRAVAKYNGSIYRLQDITGKLSRKPFIIAKDLKPSRKDFILELTNMRKLGIKYDDNKAYLVFSSIEYLYNILADVKITEANYDFDEQRVKGSDEINLNFKRSKISDSLAYFDGYYVLDSTSKAIKQFKINALFKNNPYNKNKWLRYRTTSYKVQTSFKKNPNTNLYFLSSGSYEVNVETTDEERSFTSNYNIKFILTTSDNFGDFEVTKNSSVTKDIFKLNYPYTKEYWSKQNQLLLTDEMVQFIFKMEKDGHEYKISSNLKN